jgi:hypothetical protein
MIFLPSQLKVSFGKKKKRALKLATNFSVVFCKIIFLVSKSEFQTNFLNFCWRSTAVWRSAVSSRSKSGEPSPQTLLFWRMISKKFQKRKRL